jgi:signal transduction histidine kinase/CheY-like chemotaxis protein
MEQNNKALENELRQVKQELADSQRIIEELQRSAEALVKTRATSLRILCHDYRGLLSAISGHCDLLMRPEALFSVSSPHRQYLQNIRMAVQHLLELTQDLYDVNNYEIGKPLVLQEGLVKIDDFVNDTIQLVPGANEITVSFQAGLVSLPRLNCDATRLRQILLNVIGNAVKYVNKTNGHIGITVEVADGLTFVITDNGVGINPEDIPRVLRPFERIEAANALPGLGLGLPLAQALMEAHGGTLALTSAPGRGATVRLWFPPERVHLGTSHRTESIAGSTGRRKILIVEDTPVMAKYLKDVAEFRGFETYMARIGRAAIDLALQERPDVILMDIWLPDISGLEAVYCLKKHEQTANIPIIGISANGIPEPWVLTGGCDAFLKKDATQFLTELFNRVNEVTRPGRHHSSHPEIKNEEVDVLQIVGDCIQSMEISRLPDSHGVTISWRRDQDVMPRLFNDPGGLKKILWETIAYAVIEINQGGRTQVRTDLSDGFSLIIERDRWSAEPGMGFAPLKALVERYGGKLSRHGDPESGTVMSISFPLEQSRSETLH